MALTTAIGIATLVLVELRQIVEKGLQPDKDLLEKIEESMEKLIKAAERNEKSPSLLSARNVGLVVGLFLTQLSATIVAISLFKLRPC